MTLSILPFLIAPAPAARSMPAKVSHSSLLVMRECRLTVTVLLMSLSAVKLNPSMSANAPSVSTSGVELKLRTTSSSWSASSTMKSS